MYLAKQKKAEESKAVTDMMQIVYQLSGGPVDVTLPGVTDMLIFSQAAQTSQIIPFPALNDKMYHYNVRASMELEDIRKRDEFLIEYFVGFATAEASKFRKLLVLHGGNATQPADGQHVMFRTAARFMDEQKRVARPKKA